MIIEEPYGEGLVMHRSDLGVMLLQVETGVRYSDPIDVVPCPYTYEETDEPADPDPEGDQADATEILDIILGGAL